MGKTLDPKTRRKLIRQVRIDAIDNADGTWASDFTPCFFVEKTYGLLSSDDIKAANAMARKWSKAFRKWVRETIK